MPIPADDLPDDVDSEFDADDEPTRAEELDLPDEVADELDEPDEPAPGLTSWIQTSD
jgi:hypothetical protein